jgi:hypothetical protein
LIVVSTLSALTDMAAKLRAAGEIAVSIPHFSFLKLLTLGQEFSSL